MQILKTKPLLTKADSLCLCAEISDDTTDTTPFCFGVKRYKVWSHPVYNTTLPTVINRKPKRTCQAARSNTITGGISCAQSCLLHLEFEPKLLVANSDHVFKCCLHCPLLDALLFKL